MAIVSQVDRRLSPTAVVIGASSGIGEALAHELNGEGWRLGLLARRLDRLEALRQTLAPGTIVRGIDVTQDDVATIFNEVLDELGHIDLVIISAGAGHNNRDLTVEKDLETVTVNVLGFMQTAQVAVRYFLRRGRGHLVGISSVAALRATVSGPPTRRRKRFSRYTSTACEIWPARAGCQSVSPKCSQAPSTPRC
jgi:short-subunit dehydrogenase